MEVYQGQTHSVELVQHPIKRSLIGQNAAQNREGLTPYNLVVQAKSFERVTMAFIQVPFDSDFVT